MLTRSSPAQPTTSRCCLQPLFRPRQEPLRFCSSVVAAPLDSTYKDKLAFCDLGSERSALLGSSANLGSHSGSCRLLEGSGAEGRLAVWMAGRGTFGWS